MNKKGVRAKVRKGQSFSHLEKIRPNTAGIDLGAREHYAALDEAVVEEGKPYVRVFPSDSDGNVELITWLLGHGVESVAMEATGVYWMGLYEALEDAGIDVCLANARRAKNVAGRKTDVNDAMWLQQLHSYGLLAPSFVPEQTIRDLRSYVRQRDTLIEEKSRAMMHLHKSLDMMNVKVHHRIKDMGGKAGMNILRAIAAGVSDSGQLSAFHSGRLKCTKEELERSLRGNYRPAHVFALAQALGRYDFAAQQIAACEVQIEALLSQMSPGLADLSAQEDTTKKKSDEPLGFKKNGGKKKNSYGFGLGSYLRSLTVVDLTAIDGLTESTVLSIISETGLDLKQNWPTAGHFASWLGLAPRKKISGGKIIGYEKTQGVSRASEAFRLAAYGVVNSKSALGAFYRSKRAYLGGKAANKATARKIAVIFYTMIVKQEEYRGMTQQEYESRNQSRRLRKLEREAKRLGFELKKTA